MTGCHGIVLVTTAWPQRSGSGSVSSSAFSSACAASNRRTPTAAIASRVGGTPSLSARYPAMRSASSAGVTW